MQIVSNKSMRFLNVRLLRDIRLGLFEIFSGKYIEVLICMYSEWVEIKFCAVKSQKQLFVVATKNTRNICPFLEFIHNLLLAHN